MALRALRARERLRGPLLRRVWLSTGRGVSGLRHLRRSGRSLLQRVWGLTDGGGRCVPGRAPGFHRGAGDSRARRRRRGRAQAGHRALLPVGRSCGARTGPGARADAQLGAGADRRVSAVGETTTVAGLLQQQAEPGTIVIGPATARLVTGYVRLVELGRVPLPGIDGLVETFRVTGVGPRRSPIEGLGARALSRFVGRDLEMRTLH